ncbi:MAG: hypothetical protein HQK62_09620, partial [Desulfamplus sp.]|nr:hypothetical protein [Desulfamplus sp.]
MSSVKSHYNFVEANITGGNIGDLAVNGTVNDIAMCGGDPKYISVALILEEGFSVDDL